MLGKRKRRRKRITPRDVRILRLCHEQGLLTLDQITRVFFPDNRNKYKIPLRCVNRLMKRGFLRALKKRIGKKTLYLVGVKGMRVLETRHLLNSLPYVKTVDWRIVEHDLQVTDVRLVFEKLGFEWTPARKLKTSTPRKKFPDGKAKFGNHIFPVLVEKDGTKRDKYRGFFGKRCRAWFDEAILYVVKDERTMAKRLKEAKDFSRIYFVTLDELFAREGEALFVNSDDLELTLSRVVNPGKPVELDRSLDIFRKADREYQRPVRMEARF